MVDGATIPDHRPAPQTITHPPHRRPIPPPRGFQNGPDLHDPPDLENSSQPGAKNLRGSPGSWSRPHIRERSCFRD